MSKLIGPLLILLCTVIWGSAFIAQKLGASYYGPFTINFSRNLIAGVFLVCVLAVTKRLRGRWTRQEVVGGALGGVCLFFAMLAQQCGIEYTTAGISAFLTANYVIFVPFFAWIVGRKRPSLFLVLCAVLAVWGSFLISVSTREGLCVVGRGELLTILCAMLFAVQILIVGIFAPACDVLRFSAVQMIVAGLVAFPFVFLPSEVAHLNWDSCLRGVLSLFYLGIFSSGIAYTLQNFGQARTSPPLAALVMSLESVFGAFFGWFILGDILTPRQLLGCGLVFLSVVASQALPFYEKK